MHFHGKSKKFIELVERIMIRWGYNSTEGMIYGILLLSEKPLTIKNILELTNLSRTSISTSLKRLVGDDLVSVRREKKVKYFSPNPIFREKFMEQPKELLNKEIIPIVGIIEEISQSAHSEEYKKKLINIKRNLEDLENILNIIIKIEKENIKT